MRVALLTNFIPPYRVSLYQALQRHVGQLRVFISTHMESGRAWEVDWRDLDVVKQKTITRRHTWKQAGFAEPIDMHIPYDTIIQLARFRPERIITGELGARSLQALLYARATRTPAVLWATLSDHTEQHRGRARNTLRKFMIPRFDRVIVNGEGGARYIRRFRQDPPLHVPYTTDMEPFLALPLQGRGRDLLYVGALTERKGFHLLLDAVAALNTRLIVVGDGPLHREAANIEYARHVPYDQLPHWYERAGFLIMPSLADEWGVVVNEALAAGVPVLGSKYSQAVEELIVDGQNGWRFDPLDSRGMAGLITRALALGEDEHARMRAAARETARRLHPEHAAQRIAQLLKSL